MNPTEEMGTGARNMITLTANNGYGTQQVGIQQWSWKDDRTG